LSTLRCIAFRNLYQIAHCATVAPSAAGLVARFGLFRRLDQFQPVLCNFRPLLLVTGSEQSCCLFVTFGGISAVLIGSARHRGPIPMLLLPEMYGHHCLTRRRSRWPSDRLELRSIATIGRVRGIALAPRPMLRRGRCPCIPGRIGDIRLLYASRALPYRREPNRSSLSHRRLKQGRVVGNPAQCDLSACGTVQNGSRFKLGQVRFKIETMR
jgi:hypothetical protein